MDILAEIRELEKQGVFIHMDYDHYESGTNASWSIQFWKHADKQTGWYGDNHEFGDVANCVVAAISFAKWFLEDEERLKWFFFNANETVTTQGRADWLKKREIEKEAYEHLCESYTEKAKEYINNI